MSTIIWKGDDSMLAIAFAIGMFGLAYGIELFARIKHLQKLRQMQRYVHIHTGRRE